MSAYIVVVLTGFILFAEYLWEDTSYASGDDFYDLEGKPAPRLRHYTIIFNTFVYMTVFNEINCRKVGAKAFNVFAHILKNWMFLAIIGAIIAF